MLIAVAAHSNTSDKRSSTNLLVLGDSLSAAYKMPIEKGWVYLLEQKLKQDGVKVNVRNASVSGITTAAGLEILPNALDQFAADVVVIELGANDGLQGKPVPYITQNLDKLISLAYASDAQVVLLGVRLPPNRGKRYTEPFFQQYADLADSEQTGLVPFFLAGVAGDPDFMQADGLHPNELGQPIIVENVYDVIRKAIAASHDK